jgi:DNA-binding NarL/FixJ family response regulator
MARIRGEAATARREHREARRCFEEALDLGTDAAPALEQAQALAAYGRFLRRRGERRSAVDRLDDARTRLTALDARPFLERCEEELAACGVPRTGPDRRATDLTPQEQIVAGLACRGLTNAQVAQQLVLSVKTVGYHLSNVYTKLDVHSRAQLVAAWERPDRPRSVSPATPAPR